MEEKKPRWENEMFGTKKCNPKDCENCLFRPSKFNGVKLDRADTVNCQIFEPPELKPDNVYWDGAKCEYHEKAE